MDLTKILKVGDKVYSPIIGYGIIVVINKDTTYCFKVEHEDGSWVSFTKEGKYFPFSPECVLFPSENNRDWSTWKTKK